MTDRVAGTLLHLAAIALIGAIDFALGPDIQLSVVYSVPIITASLWVGRWPGILVALAGAAAWYLNAEILPIRSDRLALISAWNGLSRVGIYALLAFAISGLRKEQLELRKVNRLREDFVSMVAHELRQPAVAMALASAGLAASSTLDASERRMLDGLREQARGLARLADQLLAIGQIEAGELRLNRIACDLRELARDAAREAHEPQRVELEAPVTPVPLRADPARLRQAIDNLVSNALKYSPAGEPVKLSVREEGSHAVLEVRDNGMGFDPAEAQELFRKYGRLRGARAARIEGTGLGLYLTRLRASAHGGDVSGRSDGPGRGTTFTLRLPLLGTRTG